MIPDVKLLLMFMSLKRLFEEQENLRFLLFGGKGGVGKTSCSAATAIWVAETHPEKKILILSTDPAHSLSDSFDQDLSGGEVVHIKGFENLFGLEINPAKEYAEYQKAMQESSQQIPSELAPMMEGFEDITDMTPPGSDETLAFAKVLEFVQKAEHDLVIFDTAPTGHTLRLLGLPDLLNSFFGKIIKVRLQMSKIWGKFKTLFKRGEADEIATIDQMQELQRTIEEAGKELSSPEKTAFVIVMISEAMAIYETERLLQALYEYEIPVNTIIVNQLFPEVLDCNFCKSRRAMQQRHLEEIRDIYDDFNLIEVPLFNDEIRGVDSLRELAKKLFD
ncbi:MAG: ArsA family ATPase [Candidatus Helarchaeota archaeon]